MRVHNPLHEFEILFGEKRWKIIKKVFIHKVIWIAELKNGRIIKDEVGYGRYVYQYDEVPDNYEEKFNNPDTVFDELLKRLNYIPEYHGDKTFFTKRIYVYDYFGFRERIYKDELVSFTIKHVFETIENPRIDYLESDLGFNGYSELIFNREQELSSMLLKN